MENGVGQQMYSKTMLLVDEATSRDYLQEVKTDWYMSSLSNRSFVFEMHIAPLIPFSFF